MLFSVYRQTHPKLCCSGIKDLIKDLINPVHKTVEPGIINQVIDVMAKQKAKEFVLAVDGKKIVQGLPKNAGDIDL